MIYGLLQMHRRVTVDALARARGIDVPATDADARPRRDRTDRARPPVRPRRRHHRRRAAPRDRRPDGHAPGTVHQQARPSPRGSSTGTARTSTRRTAPRSATCSGSDSPTSTPRGPRSITAIDAGALDDAPPHRRAPAVLPQRDDPARTTGATDARSSRHRRARRTGETEHARSVHHSVSGRDLWELIDARVAATPDNEMACDERGRRITYAEFRQRAEEVAAGIAALGIGAEDVVSWSLPTGFDAMVLSAALRRLDVVQNPIIPIYREREFGFCTRQTGAKLLDRARRVARLRLRGDGAQHRRGARPGLEVLVVDTTRRPASRSVTPATLPPRAAPPATTADGPVRWLLYTSGTTSDPKGARHGDIALDHIAGAMARAARHARPRPLRHRVPVHAHRRHHVALRHAAVRRACSCSTRRSTRSARRATSRRENVTHAGSGTPFHMAYLAIQRSQPDVPLFPHLKSCPGGGSPKPPEIHYEVKAELGGVGVVSSWGLTESPILTLLPHHRLRREARHHRGHRDARRRRSSR